MCCSGWQSLAAAAVVAAAVLTPPHAPHSLHRRLRGLMSHTKYLVAPRAQIQALRDDARAAAAALYDLPQAQEALRKTSERLAALQRAAHPAEQPPAATKAWQLFAAAAGLAAGLAPAPAAAGGPAALS
eukprot:gene25254-16367_t